MKRYGPLTIESGSSGECYTSMREQKDGEWVRASDVIQTEAELVRALAQEEEERRLKEKYERQITAYRTIIQGAIDRLKLSSHSKEKPEPYDSRTPIIQAFLQISLINIKELL